MVDEAALSIEIMTQQVADRTLGHQGPSLALAHEAETKDGVVRRHAAGAHQITLRAGDAKGNHAYETVFVNIEAQAGK